MQTIYRKSSIFFNKDEIYLYCKSGARSAAACQIMGQLGFENVYNLKGGITDWKGEVIQIMLRLRYFFERHGFSVCSRLADWMGMKKEKC